MDNDPFINQEVWMLYWIMILDNDQGGSPIENH